jgi:hypothetical protein
MGRTLVSMVISPLLVFSEVQETVGHITIGVGESVQSVGSGPWGGPSVQLVGFGLEAHGRGNVFIHQHYQRGLRGAKSRWGRSL